MASDAVTEEKLGLDEASHIEDNASSLSPEQADFKRREARVLRKLDLFITPIMLLLQLISYLDRGNIGFAATQGMAKDIGLKGNQLNVNIEFSELACS